MDILFIVLFFGVIIFITKALYQPSQTPPIRPRRGNKPEISADQIWDYLDVIQKFDLNPLPPTRGTLIATGSFRGHTLVLEQPPSEFDPYVRITMKSARPLTGDKRKSPSVSASDIAKILTSRPALQRGSLKLNIENNSLSYQRRRGELDTFTVNKSINLVADLINAYPDIIALGGEVMPTLAKAQKDYPLLRQYIMRAMKEIGKDTRSRIRPHLSQLVCPTCLTRCRTHNVLVRGAMIPNIKYYGCRTCHRSRELLKGDLVAVIDEGMSKTLEIRTNAVCVNALTYQQSLDFDAIEIRQASDEVVERFVIQVSNHLGSGRRKKLEDIRCEISPGCNLSENTIRILKRTFGEVVMRQIPQSN